MKSLDHFATLFLATLLAATLGGAAAANEEGTQYSATTPEGSGNTTVNDAALNAEVKEQIFREPSLKSSGIEVTTSQGVVRLSGTADSPDKVLSAVQMANSVAGVVSVTNDIQVK